MIGVNARYPTMRGGHQPSLVPPAKSGLNSRGCGKVIAGFVRTNDPELAAVGSDSRPTLLKRA